MHWEHCNDFQTDDGDNQTLGRFGHSLSTVNAQSTWGTELVILFGGVRAIAAQGAEGHTATNSVHVLTGDGSNTWFMPQVSHKPPQARAFHAASVVGTDVYVFGGHVLTSESEAAKRKRIFYNDLWRLDTVGI